MSKQLKLLLEQALLYLADDVWPPAELVGRIAAEAVRIGEKPPIEYQLFTSPEGAPEDIRQCFAEEPDTVSVVRYWVRDPFNTTIVGFRSWDKRKLGAQSTPDSTLVEVIRVAAFPPGKQVLRAIQAWILYLEAQGQPPAAEQSSVAAATPDAESDDFLMPLFKVCFGRVARDKLNQIEAVRKSSKTVNDKLLEIHNILPFLQAASAREIAGLLGCSATAVTKTTWWEVNRKDLKKKKAAEREKRLRDRGKVYEDP